MGLLPLWSYWSLSSSDSVPARDETNEPPAQRAPGASSPLTIHPTKTRLCYARKEPFDFLGYTFGPNRHWQTGKLILSAQPSKKARKRLKEKINTLLVRGNPTPWPELCLRLNRLLVGWAEYFSFAHTAGAYTAIRWHVIERVRRFLCRRHKLRVSGTHRFGYAEVYGKAGVVDLQQVRLRRRPAHTLS